MPSVSPVTPVKSTTAPAIHDLSTETPVTEIVFYRGGQRKNERYKHRKSELAKFKNKIKKEGSEFQVDPPTDITDPTNRKIII